MRTECHRVDDSSQVGALRRAVTESARAAGFDEADRGRLGLVATELGTNLVKHAREGQVLVRFIDTPATLAVELLSVDRGPGLGDVAVAMRDGFSTSGTAGNGLGAIARQADAFDIHDTPQGSVLRVLLRARRNGVSPPRGAAASEGDLLLEHVGVICCSKPGETACGDAWRWRSTADGGVAMVADGLGHGPLAATAARAAIAVLDAGTSDPHALMVEAHAAARGTRGAAASILRYGSGSVDFVGVGNVIGRICAETDSRQLVSHNGIVGQEARRIQAFSAPLPATALIVLHSDGLASQWSLASYPGLARRHPAVVAAVLYRDFGRGRDDTTVMVIRP